MCLVLDAPQSIIWAEQHPIPQLPEEALVFLLGSRYCETDRLSEIAWKTFANAPLGWARVQAICDFVHRHIRFGYEYASPTKTAWDVFVDRKGVCRDFAHLAVTRCRCMNIPARYCTGYLGDIGQSPSQRAAGLSCLERVGAAEPAGRSSRNGVHGLVGSRRLLELEEVPE